MAQADDSLMTHNTQIKEMIDLRLQLFKLLFPALARIFWQSLYWVAAAYAYSHLQHSVGTLSLAGYARYQAT